MEFKDVIKDIVNKDFPGYADTIMEKSLLIQYLVKKTVSADKGSKSRSSFANIYAVYVLVEDYVIKGYSFTGVLNKGQKPKKNYTKYEGAKYSDLFKRMHQLPFGDKLQNHALNNRMSSEFQKFFPDANIEPIPRNLETKRYWINDKLLKIKVDAGTIDISNAVLEIIRQYVKTKQRSFVDFVKTCQALETVGAKNNGEVKDFIFNLIKPNQDARLFEIVSYSILKYYYHNKKIYWGFSKSNIIEDYLKLYKTGRTNANDGGIDFVMRPLGRFFQVTETLDFRKYFLDIDKIERYPITFVIKTTASVSKIMDRIRNDAKETYSISQIVDKYMSCIEEVINIPLLQERFEKAVEWGYLNNILEEIILQSKVEFNLNADLEE